MDRAAAKELLHIDGWLERSAQIVERGKDAYLADDLLQEAGDSLMMKLGEAANRLSRLDVLAPDGVDDLPAWRKSLAPPVHCCLASSRSSATRCAQYWPRGRGSWPLRRRPALRCVTSRRCGRRSGRVGRAGRTPLQDSPRSARRG